MSTEAEALGERIAEMAAHLDAATHRLLTDLREYDRSNNWYQQGFPDCARWLSWRVGWSVGTARDRVRVAQRLGELPLIDDALRTGTVSYSKVRAMTRVATDANEAFLLEDARHATGQQLELICRKYATVVRAAKEVDEDHDRERRMVSRRDLEDGMVRIEATLRPEEAAVVWAALDRVRREGAARLVDENKNDEQNVAAAVRVADRRPAGRFTWADALLEIAHEVVRGDAPSRSPIELVVTVSAEMLHGPAHGAVGLRAASTSTPTRWIVSRTDGTTAWTARMAVRAARTPTPTPRQGRPSAPAGAQIPPVVPRKHAGRLSWRAPGTSQLLQLPCSRTERVFPRKQRADSPATAALCR